MRSLLGAVLLVAGTAFLVVPAADGQSAREVLDASGVQGGVVVHLGCGDGTWTAGLRVNDRYLVHGLDADPDRVAAARRSLLAAGRYGPVSFDTYDGRRLPYADNTVNLVVALDPPGVPEAEILRVLAPRGVALVGGRRQIKPVPPDIDDWSHFEHGPENNPVADDTVVGPPRRMQWTAGPRSLRSHEVPSGITSLVTAGGRVFYTLDEGPIGVVDGRFPEKWSLLARDAFNGMPLWKIPLPRWGWQTWRSSLKTADMTAVRGLRTTNPRDYRYRMVADAERLYFTLGNQAPVSILDAATGKELATCKGTEACRKLLLSGGILLAEVGGDLLAFDAPTGRELWRKSKVTSTAAHGSRVVYRGAGKAVHCVEAKTGKAVWEGELAVPGNLLIAGDAILSAAGSAMQTLSLKDGKPVWSTGTGGGKKGRGKSSEIYVVGDTIWLGYRGQRVDLKTGRKLPDLGVENLWSPQHHHRCYSNKATRRFIIGAMEGMEYLAIDGSNDHSRNNWARGTCSIGIFPANGMTYVPPDQCYCSTGVKLLGFSALLAAGETPPADPPEKRLQKGPAYGQAPGGDPGDADWPAFRHDALRSGAQAGKVPAELRSAWQADLGGVLTQPVVAGDLLLIASRDTHTLHALDAKTGGKRWQFTAGGRIDSPPTIHGGLALFGSADGHVYALRSTDGELAWRFRAAPHERLVGSFGQLESAWPVHGSVLLLDGVAYVSAGRSTYLDGGLFLYGLDPATGKVLHRHQETGPYEDHTKDHGHSYWSEGARNDVLVSDGEHIYIMQLRFNRKLEPVPAKTESLLGDRRMGRRLFSTSGLLDDEWYNRTFWMHSAIWPGYYLANQASKSGQMLVFDKETTYGVKVFWTRNRHSPMFFPAKHGYLLFADDNDNEPILVGRDAGKALEWLPKFNLSRGGDDTGKTFGPNLGAAPQISDVNAYTFNKDKGVGYTRVKAAKWAVWVPVRVKAMVATGETLFVAGAPDVLDEKDPLAALEGRKGGVLRAVSVTDGKSQAEYPLDAPPVLDGLIAAQGRLYLATRDGKLTCWGK